MTTTEGETFVTSVLDQLEQLNLSIPLETEEIHRMTDCFRALRNLCAVDLSLKDLLVEKRWKTVETTAQLLKVYCRSGATEEFILLGRCGLQFLGNLVVDHTAAQIGVWRCLREFIVELLNSDDQKMSAFAAMVVFNCLNNDNLEDICSNAEHFGPLINSLVRLFHSDVEWALYSLQSLLKVPKFLESFYSRLESDDGRLLLLSVLVELIRTEDNYSPHVAQENVEFLSTEFQQFCSALRNGQLEVVEVTKAAISLKILTILCECGRDCESPAAKSLQHQSALVKTTVETLSYIHTLSTVEESVFVRVKNLAACVKVEYGQQSFFGFKRDLVRLVANFAFNHDDNKRLIRELGGIPIVLECTVVDANNPFITQWAIFALKNLCENCLDNQQFVAMMSPQSLADNQPLVEQLNLQLTVDPQGKSKLTVKPPTEHS